MFYVTKEFKFPYGHCLDLHKGLCKNTHGHNGRLLITLKSKELNDMDMVMDFTDLKNMCQEYIDTFDHAFVYNKNCTEEYEKELYSLNMRYNRKTVVFSGRATAENFAKHFYDYVKAKLPEGVQVHKVTFYETDSSFAEYMED